MCRAMEELEKNVRIEAAHPSTNPKRLPMIIAGALRIPGKVLSLPQVKLRKGPSQCVQHPRLVGTPNVMEG